MPRVLLFFYPCEIYGHGEDYQMMYGFLGFAISLQRQKSEAWNRHIQGPLEENFNVITKFIGKLMVGIFGEDDIL